MQRWFGWSKADSLKLAWGEQLGAKLFSQMHTMPMDVTLLMQLVGTLGKAEAGKGT